MALHMFQDLANRVLNGVEHCTRRDAEEDKFCCKYCDYFKMGYDDPECKARLLIEKNKLVKAMQYLDKIREETEK